MSTAIHVSTAREKQRMGLSACRTRREHTGRTCHPRHRRHRRVGDDAARGCVSRIVNLVPSAATVFRRTFHQRWCSRGLLPELSEFAGTPGRVRTVDGETWRSPRASSTGLCCSLPSLA